MVDFIYGSLSISIDYKENKLFYFQLIYSDLLLCLALFFHFFKNAIFFEPKKKTFTLILI